MSRLFVAIADCFSKSIDAALECYATFSDAVPESYATLVDAALECYATLLTWLPLIMPQELQGGVPNAELDCVYPLAVVKTVI